MAYHWSSGKEHKADALALGADEGRGKLRKAAVSRKRALQPQMSEWGNPAAAICSHPKLNP